MATLSELRESARAVFDETLAALDAGEAVGCAVRVEGSRLTIVEADFHPLTREFYAVGLGKAAGAMAAA
ncbi:MAG TPA: DUF4147 domain-containing protein, partial [Pyrinomonadaceae bacterium]